MKIITRHDKPPIPNRNFDWTAIWDDYDGAEDSTNRNHVGYGSTMREAIADLRENYPKPPDCDRCMDNYELPNGDVCPECCPHDETDHGICLDCHKDVFNDIVAAAEFRADCREDR